MNFKEKLSNNYWLNDPLPIMILYLVDTVLFTNVYFARSVQAFVQVVMMVYVTVLSLYNIYTRRAFEGKKILVISMYAFIISNIVSFCFTHKKGESPFAFYLVYMVAVHYLALGLPRFDLDQKKRISGINIAIYVYIAISTLHSTALLISENVNLLSYLTESTNRLIGFGGHFPGSTSIHPNTLGFLSSITAFFIVYVFLTIKNKLFKGILALSFVINVFTLYLTKSRSSQIFLLVALLSILLIFMYKRFSLKLFIVALSSCALIGVAGISVIALSRGVNNSLSFYDLLNSISSKRMDLYVGGIKAGIDSPIFGNSYSYLSEIYAPVHMAHNVYIDLFARYGVVSLLGFSIFNFALLFYSIKALRKKENGEGSILFFFAIAMLVGMLVQHLVDVYIYYVGFSSGNILWLIMTGYMSYYIKKTEMVQ